MRASSGDGDECQSFACFARLVRKCQYQKNYEDILDCKESTLAVCVEGKVLTDVVSYRDQLACGV